MSTTSQSVNIPQLVVLLIVSALAIRWLFFSSSSSSSTSSNTSSATNGRNINPAMVEQIAQMFPQLDRREIMWDLQRNGGDRRRTVERVLMGRGLESPPISFQPNIPSPTQPSTSSARPSPNTPARNKSAHPDLISRYNLQSKINTPPSQQQQQDVTNTDETPSPLKKQGWSANKAERQTLLQRRREEMILEARRKLEEKEKAGRV